MIKAGFHWQLRSPKWSRKSPYDSVKIKNRSCKQSHKLNRIGVTRIRTFPFLPTLLMTPLLCSAYDLVKTRLLESQVEAEG